VPRERCPGPASVGGWVGPRAGVDALWKRKINLLPVLGRELML